MNYPLLTILITKMYMIYNSNFIYTWQLLDQVRDRFSLAAVGGASVSFPYQGRTGYDNAPTAGQALGTATRSDSCHVYIIFELYISL